MTKGTVKLVEEEVAFFRLVGKGNTVGCLLISLLLKATDST